MNAVAKKNNVLLPGPVWGILFEVTVVGVATATIGVGWVGGAVVVGVEDGVVVEVDEVSVILGPVSVVVLVVTTLVSLPMSALYAHFVPVKIPNSSPPTRSMPTIVMAIAAGLLTELVAFI